MVLVLVVLSKLAASASSSSDFFNLRLTYVPTRLCCCLIPSLDRWGRRGGGAAAARGEEQGPAADVTSTRLAVGGEGEEGEGRASGGVNGTNEEPREERMRGGRCGGGGRMPEAADDAEAKEIERVVESAGDKAEEVTGDG
ncbi:hypothetical protein ABZP36_000291 [Zizania latifolia]